MRVPCCPKCKVLLEFRDEPVEWEITHDNEILTYKVVLRDAVCPQCPFRRQTKETIRRVKAAQRKRVQEFIAERNRKLASRPKGKHSPAPWVVTSPPEVLGLVAANGRPVAGFEVDPDHLHSALEDAANATLAAQAPAMLAVLQQLLERWHLFQSSDRVANLQDYLGREEMERVARVIARATGQPVNPA